MAMKTFFYSAEVCKVSDIETEFGDNIIVERNFWGRSRRSCKGGNCIQDQQG